MEEEIKNSEKEDAPPKKKNLIGRIGKILFRALIYSVFFIFLLIASAGLVLEYYFPAEEARVLAEGQLTKILKLPLKIQKIGFSLLSGLQLDNVALGFASKPVVRVKKVVFDYDLTQLLQGKLVINQVLIDHPQLTANSKNGVWNFQPLLELSKPTGPVAKNDKSKTPFPLPEIAIKELNIRNASVRLDQDGKLNAHIDGLSLEAQGKASLDALDLKLKVLLNPDKTPNIEFQSKGEMSFRSRVFSNLEFSASDLNHLLVSGEFGLKSNRITLKALTLPSPDVAVILDAKVSMQPELLNLNKLQMSLGKNNQLKVSGKATHFSKDPSFELMIDEASFQLEDLLDWGKQWAPPLSGQGLLSARALKVSGSLPGFILKNLNVKGGTLSTKDLWINYPDQNARLESMTADLELKEIVLQNSQLGKASLNINMQLKKGAFQKAQVTDWKQALNFTVKGKKDVLFDFRTEIKSAQYDHPEIKELVLPVHAEGSGYFKNNDLNNLKLSYQLGTLANGEVAGTVKNLGRDSIKLNQNISLNLAEATRQLPKKFTLELAENFQGTAKAHTSITGKLDNGFSPVELNGLANLQLEGLTAQLKKPSTSINNLNTRISFPFEFNSDKGARIPHLDIHTDFLSAEALDSLKINAFELDTKIIMKAFHNLEPEFGTFPMQMDSQVALGNLSSQSPALSLSDLKSNITVKTDLQSDDVRNTRVEGKLAFKNLSAMETLKTGEWLSRFNLDVHDKSLTRVRFSQKTQINKPAFHQADLKLDLKSVRLETVSRQNLKVGEVDIDSLFLQIPDLVDVQFKAALKEWGKAFDIDGKIEKLQLGPLWDHLPIALKSGLESLKAGGTMGISLKAKGNLPNNAPEDGGPKTITQPMWKQLLVPAQIDGKTPIEIETEIQLNNGSLEDSEKKIHADALNTKTRLTFKKGHTDLKGNFSGKLKGLAEISLHPEFEFHYALDNLNTLRVKQHHLSLMNNGVKHSLEGHIKGLKSFVTGQQQFTANELLNRLDIKLFNTNTIDIGQAVNENTDELFGSLKAEGVIESKIKFHQNAGKILSLGGSLEFDRFGLQLPSGIALKNLTGTFPFTKSLLLDPEKTKEKSSDFFPAQKKFFTSLRNFSRFKNIIRADSLEIKEQVLSDIGLDVVFKDNRLMVEKFIFDVLGGSVGGNLFLIQDRQGPVIKFSTEFAGIDSSNLLAIPLDDKIDSKIDGNLQIELKINTGSANQPVSLDQLSVNIAITRTGTQTLDRLLLYIDPEESKPAIMDTRAKLKLATPHRVEIILENGNLNVEAWLKSDLLGIFKAPELKRVPVAALKRFNTIHEHLQALKSLEQISNYLSARGLQFENEKMILQY
jgi:hypothetical protein